MLQLQRGMITSADVMAAVLPIWSSKRETASRVRQRISAVMKWCVAQGYRSDDPAGATVLQALPKGVGTAKRHHRALPYGEVGQAMRRVRESRAWLGTKLAFEFLVLTACRSGEVRGARWGEVGLPAATWTVPADRMKAKAEHRVTASPSLLIRRTRGALSDGDIKLICSPADARKPWTASLDALRDCAWRMRPLLLPSIGQGAEKCQR